MYLVLVISVEYGIGASLQRTVIDRFYTTSVIQWQLYHRLRSLGGHISLLPKICKPGILHIISDVLKFFSTTDKTNSTGMNETIDTSSN